MYYYRVYGLVFDFPPNQMISALQIVSNIKGLYLIERPVGVDTLEDIYSEVNKILQ